MAAVRLVRDEVTTQWLQALRALPYQSMAPAVKRRLALGCRLCARNNELAADQRGACAGGVHSVQG